MQWLASIISHSKSGSSINISSSRSHTPLSRQRINLRWVLLQPPKSGGKSRHGAPVRMIQKTASIKRRLSWATPPQLPSRPGKRGSSFFQTASEMSCRLWAGRDMWSSLAVEGKRTMPQNQILDNLVTTLSKPPCPQGTDNHANETSCFSSRTLHACSLAARRAQ